MMEFILQPIFIKIVVKKICDNKERLVKIEKDLSEWKNICDNNDNYNDNDNDNDIK